MDVRHRLPTLLAVAAGLVLAVVVAGRVTAGTEPPPRDTSPIVVDGTATPGPDATTPTPGATAEPTRKGPHGGSVTPRIRHDDDDDGPDDDDRDEDDDDDDD